jgi:hypothetical protein
MTDFCRVYLNRECTIFTMVDAVFYETVSVRKWQIHLCSRGNAYATRRVHFRSTCPRIYMHQTIMVLREYAMLSEGLSRVANGRVVIDHINGNTLDNRVSNLRWTTYSENERNVNEKKREGQRWTSLTQDFETGTISYIYGEGNDHHNT